MDQNVAFQDGSVFTFKNVEIAQNSTLIYDERLLPTPMERNSSRWPDLANFIPLR